MNFRLLVLPAACLFLLSCNAQSSSLPDNPDKKSEFVRTPKYQIMNKKDSWKGKNYVNKKLSFTTYIEALLAVYCFAGVVIAVATAQVAAVPFQLMFCGGFATISILSIRQVVLSNRINAQKLALDAK